jgi:lipoprotein-anchoring transpeptidase ErfK/SrfK
MSNHRRDVRPRYGRIVALAASVTVTAVAALAGFGVLATGSAQAGPAARAASFTRGVEPSPSVSDTPSVTPDADASDSSLSTLSTSSTPTAPETDGPAASVPDTGQADRAPDPTALPAASGTGRRIVFDQSAQRVWLVGAQDDDVQRTYPVSGSVTNNLQPGTYSVYSQSRWAVGVDDSGVMQYFVRFTQGPTGAAIGFHSIPTKNGVPQQTKAQLGTPQSHGCIRQNLPDAIALWNFAPVGTKVVVVA